MNQERLERFKNSSRETTLTLSPVRIEQETLVIPDSPIQSLETPDIIVNPVERREVPDNSISSSSESPATPLESSNKFSLTIRESPDNIIKTKSSLSPARQVKMTVKVAKLSKELPGQRVEKKTLYEVLPVEHFQSPSEFSIRLKIEVSFKRIIQKCCQ